WRHSTCKGRIKTLDNSSCYLQNVIREQKRAYLLFQLSHHMKMLVGKTRTTHNTTRNLELYESCMPIYGHATKIEKNLFSADNTKHSNANLLHNRKLSYVFLLMPLMQIFFIVGCNTFPSNTRKVLYTIDKSYFSYMFTLTISIKIIDLCLTSLMHLFARSLRDRSLFMPQGGTYRREMGKGLITASAESFGSMHLLQKPLSSFPCSFNVPTKYELNRIGKDFRQTLTDKQYKDIYSFPQLAVITTKFNVDPKAKELEKTGFQSCQDLLRKKKFSPNGAYTLQENVTSSPYKVYCHMTDISGCGGGGWTLILKVDGDKTRFEYDSPWWTNRESYAVEDGLEGLTEKESKLPSYWNTPFKKICLGMTVNGDRKWMMLDYEASSLYSVIADENTKKHPFLVI
ncbi:Hypothetical predicted protein, partial [Paramuricea clavata]